MSHPDPNHDPENVRTDDNSHAPIAKKKAMAGKMRHWESKASKVFPKEFRRYSPSDKLAHELKKEK